MCDCVSHVLVSHTLQIAIKRENLLDCVRMQRTNFFVCFVCQNQLHIATQRWNVEKRVWHIYVSISIERSTIVKKSVRWWCRISRSIGSKWIFLTKNKHFLVFFQRIKWCFIFLFLFFSSCATKFLFFIDRKHCQQPSTSAFVSKKNIIFTFFYLLYLLFAFISTTTTNF